MMAKEKSVSEETPLIPAAEILQDFRLDSHVQSYFRPMVSAYLYGEPSCLCNLYQYSREYCWWESIL